MARRQDFQNIDDVYQDGYSPSPYYDDNRQQPRRSRQDMAAMQYEEMVLGNSGRRPAASSLPESPGPVPIIAVVLAVLTILLAAATGFIPVVGIAAAVCAVIAIVLGIVSVVRSGSFDGAGRGKGIAAIILTLFAGAVALGSIIFVPTLLTPRQEPADVQDSQQLEQDAAETEPSQQQEPVVLNEGQDQQEQYTDNGLDGTYQDDGEELFPISEIAEDGNLSLTVYPRTTETHPALISLHNWESDSGSRLELHEDGTFIWYRDTADRSTDINSSGWFQGTYWLMTGKDAVDFAVNEIGIDRTAIDEYVNSQDKLGENDYIAMRLFRQNGVRDHQEISWDADKAASDFTGWMVADDAIFMYNVNVDVTYNFRLAD